VGGGVGCGLHRAGGSGQEATRATQTAPAILESHKKCNGRGLPGGIGGLVGMVLVYKEWRGGLSGLRGWDCTGLARTAA